MVSSLMEWVGGDQFEYSSAGGQLHGLQQPGPQQLSAVAGHHHAGVTTYHAYLK